MSVYKVRQGEIKLISEPEDILKINSLGATLAVCLSDPVAGISTAGVFIVPGKIDSIQVPEWMEAASVSAGLPVLFKKFIDAGGSKDNMKIWMVGCGRFMESASELDIGLQLYSVAKKIVEKNKLSITGEHVGGPINRSVSMTCGAENLVVTMVDNTEVTI